MVYYMYPQANPCTSVQKTPLQRGVFDCDDKFVCLTSRHSREDNLVHMRDVVVYQDAEVDQGIHGKLGTEGVDVMPALLHPVSFDEKGDWILGDRLDLVFKHLILDVLMPLILEVLNDAIVLAHKNIPRLWFQWNDDAKTKGAIHIVFVSWRVKFSLHVSVGW